MPPAEMRAMREALAASLRRRTPRCYGTWGLATFHLTLFAVVSYATRSLSLQTDAAIAWGADFPARIIGGEWWRMLTGAALHGSPLHLILNLSALAMVGPTVERLTGTRGFVMVYIACALAGSALSLAGGSARVTVGASGAILGLFGVLLALAFPRNRRGAAADDPPVAPVDRRLLDAYIGMAVSAVATTLLFGSLLPHVNNSFTLEALGWAVSSDGSSEPTWNGAARTSGNQARVCWWRSPVALPQSRSASHEGRCIP